MYVHTSGTYDSSSSLTSLVLGCELMIRIWSTSEEYFVLANHCQHRRHHILQYSSPKTDIDIDTKTGYSVSIYAVASTLYEVQLKISREAGRVVQMSLSLIPTVQYMAGEPPVSTAQSEYICAVSLIRV